MPCCLNRTHDIREAIHRLRGAQDWLLSVILLVFDYRLSAVDVALRLQGRKMNLAGVDVEYQGVPPAMRRQKESRA